LLNRKDIMSIQALREQLSHETRAAKALLEANGDRAWSKDDQAKYDAHMDTCERLQDQIKAHQRMLDADAEREFKAAAKDASKRTTGEISALDAVALYLRHGNNVNADQAAAIRNAMSTTTSSEGGFTVPAEVASMVIDALKAFGGMREVAQVVSSMNGQAWNYPSSDGTSEVGEIVGENAAATTGEITFGSVPLVVYKYSSKKIALPWELVQDSAIDVVGFVVNRLAQRLGRITNTHHTVGTGSSQPFGLMARATSGKVGTTGQTTTVTYDDLVDLEHSLDPVYRTRAGVGFMMHDQSLKAVRKIKDTQGRPVFVPGYEQGNPGGAPDRLLGRPIYISQEMPVMAANAKSVLFGDFKSYIIREVMDLTLFRMTDSAYTLKGQVGFVAFNRQGGNLIDVGGAVKAFQNSAT
jgi:HK97 family phage major capsid protein